ncbi:NADH-ubiquinone oxidoreductase-F iron-sulfur binding region domain-containing protein [Arenibaculum sp.]|uniref:NADH-ubiquinone oxidoreductase-F iron-sulfur binding region domain-containing protein n=1 Tax=Arenibaculum sp. TaxID=2865862 RepID=UPI002E139376|nr:NADH-ubiquinone oxidoreductase-F iron-sulfur binding region domain-containing protein [Arenibaculum sp.]
MAEHADRITRGRSTGGTGRRAPPRPKGRQVEPAALEEVRALLGAAPRSRDFLLDHLHRLQDRFGHLSARHLAALAHELRLAQAEVFEVASFYAHFDLVMEGEAPPPPLTVRICDGISCELAGAGTLAEAVGAAVPSGVRVLRAPCMGACDRAPAAAVGHRSIAPATPDMVAAALSGAPEDAVPPSSLLAAYRAAGGYRLLEDCLQGRRTAEDVIAILEDGALRGMGGAGFPTGRKWHFVRSGPAPRMMAVNADEGEPGTFKDRHFLLTDPHRVLEGMLVAAWAVGAGQVVFYLRDEYPDCRAVLERELAAVEAAGLSRHASVRLVRGAGAYICGEESAMLESIEGRRPLPRHKPPFPAQSGLFGRPTLINNVETLYWVRDVVERGPSWWAAQGRNGAKGLRAYSVSGRVREPGVKIVPAGTTLNELVAEHCGGMAQGHRLKAYLPGGASGGLLPASMADLPLDFGVLEPHGCFVGSGAVVVLSDRDDLRQVALNLLRFFADESCGQCTPCRVGTEKAVTLIEKAPGEHALLEDLARVMTDASICGLGQAAMNPVRAILRHFPEALS